jgi:hypothetical protein
MAIFDGKSESNFKIASTSARIYFFRQIRPTHRLIYADLYKSSQQYQILSVPIARKKF